MTVITHQLNGLVFVLLFLNVIYFVIGNDILLNFDYHYIFYFLLVAILGSIFPDIDEPNSYIGRRFYIISKIFKKIFGHRGFTHSLFGLVVFVLLFYLFIFFFFSNFIIYPYFIILFFGIGYLSHLIGDFITSNGIPLLYPFYNKRFSLSLFSTGSAGEDLFRIFLGLLFIFLVYLLFKDNLFELNHYFKEFSSWN